MNEKEEVIEGKKEEKEVKKEKKKSKELEEKIKEIKSLKEENESLKDKNMRVTAEMVNTIRRKDEEVSRLLKYSNESLIIELLPVIDNFERAFSMDDDNLEDEVSKFLSGMKIIYNNIKSVLDKYEVKEIDALNKEFDPSFHQAVMQEEKEGVKPNIVIEVMQKGYTYKDKVIRPAMVKVSK